MKCWQTGGCTALDLLLSTRVLSVSRRGLLVAFCWATRRRTGGQVQPSKPGKPWVRPPATVFVHRLVVDSTSPSVRRAGNPYAERARQGRH